MEEKMLEKVSGVIRLMTWVMLEEEMGTITLRLKDNKEYIS